MIANTSKITALSCMFLVVSGCSGRVDLSKTKGGVFFTDGFFLKGIPYAEPPVGDLSWRSPVDVVFDEQLHLDPEFGASCIANKKKSFVSALSEDCLYLNVWSSDLEGKLQIMAWIHGGGLSNGHGNVAGELLLERGVVVVPPKFWIFGSDICTTLGGSAISCENCTT
ncbi:MAG: hypothetical protein CBC09_09690 [Cellvibrionales bacterium TMED49]|nr:hypothetical protein [Porticoccaceae bacterium]OUU35035.1 MAG: hypothetical protein CBC09_09690 [Cellvibrionales bacterium TMED49]